ncbi:hypothetical protein pipiens_002645 [Culex pipiens pipiens]|uniref:Uncharacterized protein n=1 Tax=Culex pipiens pipiens TaxID=38569 RepID=A0ABD1DAD3_CULPP
MFRKLLSVPPLLPCAFRHFSICELPPELTQLQQTCRAFVNSQLKPIAAELDRESRFPKETIEQLADLGMMRVTVDPEYPGGSGQGMLALSLIVEELSRGCGSTGSIVSIHNCLYANLLDRVGSGEQKDRFFRKYSCGTLGAFALSEADAGSDVAALSTRAVEDGDGFVLNGTKAWVTSALQAKSGIIFATVNPELKYKGITAFLVDFEERRGLR